MQFNNPEYHQNLAAPAYGEPSQFYYVEQQEPMMPVYDEPEAAVPAKSKRAATSTANRKRPKRKQVKNACGEYYFYSTFLPQSCNVAQAARSVSALGLLYILCLISAYC